MEIKGKRWRGIRVIEFVVFFFGWTAILMAGADFPPPRRILPPGHPDRSAGYCTDAVSEMAGEKSERASHLPIE